MIKLQTDSYMCTNVSCTTNLWRLNTCYSDSIRVNCLRYACISQILLKVIRTSIYSVIILAPLLRVFKPIKLILRFFYIKIIFSTIPRNIYFNCVFPSFCSKNLK
nr:MAG TPA: hypothetical protein [Caudoviricetes sp.]